MTHSNSLMQVSPPLTDIRKSRNGAPAGEEEKEGVEEDEEEKKEKEEEEER